MGTLLIINLGGQPYGFWEDDISRTTTVPSVHSLPMTPKHFAGVADVGERMASLYDISACMGHEKLPKSGASHAIIVAEDPNPIGFAYSSDGGRISADHDEVFPLPGGMESREIHGVMVRDDEIIVILNIRQLFSRATHDEWSPPSVEFKGVSEPTGGGYRMFKAGGQSFAVSSGGTDLDTPEIGKVFNLPIAPDFIAGITLVEGIPTLLVDTPLRLGIKTEPCRRLLHSATGISISIDSDLGSHGYGASDILPLPPLARSSLMLSAIVAQSDLSPVLNLGDILRQKEVPRFKELYKGRSGFLDSFGIREVEMIEFPLLGEICGIPGEQVEDVIDFKGYRSIPGIHSIMIGIAAYKGDLLPVLDLALCFGLRSVIKPDWKYIVIKNGEFRALVPSREVSDKFILSLEDQQKLPINQQYRYVYGCYTIEARVRLMLNVKTLTTHFDEALVSKVFESFYRDIEENQWAVTAARYEKAEAAARREAGDSEDEAPDLAAMAAAFLSSPDFEYERVEETGSAKESPVAGIESDTGWLSEEEIERLAAEEAETVRLAQEEEGRKTTEEEAQRAAAEQEARRLEEEEAQRAAAEQEARRLEEEEAQRAAAEQEARRLAEEEAQRAAAEQEARRLAEEEAPFINRGYKVTEEPDIEVTEEVSIASSEARDTAVRIARETISSLDREAELLRSAPEAFESERLKKHRPPSRRTDRSRKGLLVALLLLLLILLFATPIYLVRYQSGTKSPDVSHDGLKESAGISQKNLSKVEEEKWADRRAEEQKAEKLVEEEAQRRADEEIARIAAEEKAAILVEQEAVKKAAKEKAKDFLDKRTDHKAQILNALSKQHEQYIEAQEELAKLKEEESARKAADRTATQEAEEKQMVIYAPPDSETTVHTVVRGDTLWHITKKYAGDPFKYPEVARKNRIKNPDRIYPGQEIRIEPLKE